MIKLKRKAQGNLEIVISFIIFIGFVFFLFLIFPVARKEKSQVGIDAAELGIINFTGSQMTYFTIFFNETATSIDNPNNCIKFSQNITSRNISVRDENDTLVNSIIDNSEIIINSTKKFYQIYSSSGIESEDFHNDGCKEIGENDFKLGMIRESYVLSYSRLIELNKTYFSGYNALISDFNIPNREDFGFSLREINGEIIVEAVKKKPSRDVIAREIPVQILYSDGSLKYAILHIEEW